MRLVLLMRIDDCFKDVLATVTGVPDRSMRPFKFRDWRRKNEGGFLVYWRLKPFVEYPTFATWISEVVDPFETGFQQFEHFRRLAWPVA